MIDFDEAVDRRHTCSYKWDSRSDVPSDVIPLWVADMDFKACEPVIEALRSRVEHGVFGYTFVPEEYYQAIRRWFGRYHDWDIPASQIIYTSGVVPAISAIVQALTMPGDKVIVQTPVYNCFFSSIRNAGCEPYESPLLCPGEDTYIMDMQDLERKASDPKCTLMLLCNPHNPGGRVWRRGELERVARICAANGVTVVSDEIHCELVFEPNRYIPFATVAGDCKWVSCISPSKAFNIAGLQIANIVAADAELRRRIDRMINRNEVCDVNPFGVTALMAAYNDGRPWLDALLKYLWENYEVLKDRFNTELPELTVFQLEGTYLAWIDCRRLGMLSADLEEYLIKQCGVWVNAGSMYGTDGEGYIRINLACQRSRLTEGLERLIPTLKQLLPC